MMYLPFYFIIRNAYDEIKASDAPLRILYFNFNLDMEWIYEY